jgi:hypothetical protein
MVMVTNGRQYRAIPRFMATDGNRPGIEQRPVNRCQIRAIDIPAKIKSLVAGATFTIKTKERGNGQCVLVDGGLILTAAHCVDWNCLGGMAQGDYYLSKIRTGNGELIASIRAVEPVSDVAVLSSPDDQEFFDESEAFREYCERVSPVKLLREIPESRKPFPVWIRADFKTWVAGMAKHDGNQHFGFETETEIKGGTSGGPIVNRKGELIGVVSHGSTSRCPKKYVFFCRAFAECVTSLGYCANPFNQADNTKPKLS